MRLDIERSFRQRDIDLMASIRGGCGNIHVMGGPHGHLQLYCACGRRTEINIVDFMSEQKGDIVIAGIQPIEEIGPGTMVFAHKNSNGHSYPLFEPIIWNGGDEDRNVSLFFSGGVLSTGNILTRDDIMILRKIRTDRLSHIPDVYIEIMKMQGVEVMGMED